MRIRPMLYERLNIPPPSHTYTHTPTQFLLCCLHPPLLEKEEPIPPPPNQFTPSHFFNVLSLLSPPLANIHICTP